MTTNLPIHNIQLLMGPSFAVRIILSGEVTQKRLRKLIAHVELAMPDYPEDTESATALILATLDYTKIPRKYDGQWVLINIKSQQVVSAGNDPLEAMEGFDPDDSELVLTVVPIYGRQGSGT